jgi:hypothetical protein
MGAAFWGTRMCCTCSAALPGELWGVPSPPAGENDLEMLQLASVGVAMGNAGANVTAAAQFTTATNDAGGVADAIERFVLQPRRVVVQ